MKKTGKLVSIILALAVALTMIVGTGAMIYAEENQTPAASTTYTLTLNNTGKTAHTFEVYQIFTGDLSTTGVLSNVSWGSGISAAGQTALGDATEKAEALAASTSENAADDFADSIKSYLQNPTTTSAVAAGSGTAVTLAPGYYLVRDVAGSQTGENSVYTSYIVQVVKDTTVDTKLDSPTVEKKVKDVNDSEADSTTGWQDSADYDIGDDVPYQITGTLPSNYADYDTYFYQFSDSMSKGLAYNSDAKITIGAGGTDITSSFTEATATAEDGSTTVTWTCNNLKAVSGVSSSASIVVSYSCRLDTDAVIGADGNPNTVKLLYSNNPNESGDGANDSHGETPEDKNIVFTYKVVANKVDENGDPLTGAGFTLYKKNASDEYAAVGTEIKGDALTTFTWNGVDDGDYKISETTTPAGYNTIQDIEFTVSAGHQETADSPTLTSLSGGDKFTGEVSTGALTADIENKKGSTLPTTGGMGTTVFYVIGAILVIGAGIILVSRRKTEK